MEELETLFLSCKEEISLLQEDDLYFEINSDQFTSSRDSEEIKLLFNLARLSIENPEIELKKDKLLTSDLRKISNLELEKVLTATEEAIAVPKISLKEISSERTKKINVMLLNSVLKEHKDIYSRHAKKIIPAAPSLRFISFCTDFILSLILSAFISYLLIYTKFPALNNSISHIADINTVESLPLISMITVILGFMLIIYPLLSHLILKNTLGNIISGIKLISEDQKKLNLPQIVVRCTLFPLSLITFSWLALFFNKKTLQDYFSGTLLTR